MISKIENCNSKFSNSSVSKETAKKLHSTTHTVVFLISVLFFWFLPLETSAGSHLSESESWWVNPNYSQLIPSVMAVLPMDNFSLEPGVEKALYKEVYDRLVEKGYMKISAKRIQSVMKSLGIQTPGQIAGISPSRLGRKLNCDAVLLGKLDQSASIHNGPYDAVVVSCSLKLLHCATGKSYGEQNSGERLTASGPSIP